MAEILLEAQAAGNLISERLGRQGGGGRGHHSPSQNETEASLLLGTEGFLEGAIYAASSCSGVSMLSSLRRSFLGC